MTTAATSLTPRTAAPNPWQMVTVAARDSGAPRPQLFQVPAMQADRLDSAWLQGIPKPLSPDMHKALEQSGHQVEMRRELLPVPMNDGRQLVVPVDQVDIQYVGQRSL